MIECIYCKIEKDEGLFGRISKNNSTGACKECINTYQRNLYHTKTKEKVLAKQKIYYAENTEECINRGKLYRAKNREFKKERSREYYKENKDKICERTNAYYHSSALRKKAHSSVRLAINKGLIEKQICEVCGRSTS